MKYDVDKICLIQTSANITSLMGDSSRLLVLGLFGILLTFSFISFLPQSMAEEIFEEFRIPGHLEGVGNRFEVTDSFYLNVIVDSSEPIQLLLDSIPEVILMDVSSHSSSVKSSCELNPT